MKKLLTYFSSRQWKLIPVIFISLMISLACLSSTGISSTASSVSSTATDILSTTTPESGAASAEVKLDFGPGPFDFPDTRAGLTDLASYKANLTLTFDGSSDGKSQKWVKTYVMQNAKEPAAVQLTIDKTGDLTDLDPVFLAELNGVDYERRGENASCSANVVEVGNSLGDRQEPASFLNFVVGAEEAGSETVNDVAANHYTFDERASGQSDIAKSTGEMWVAIDGGYIVKYLLTTKGNADYFGEGIEGTITWDYELTDINQPVTVTLPDDCPGGMVNAPLLPDASDTLSLPGILTYATSASLTDIVAFYQQEIPNLGWESAGEPTITDTAALMDYIQGDQTLTIIVTTGDTGTTVNVVLGSSQGAVPSP
jgi:hypothetical protein